MDSVLTSIVRFNSINFLKNQFQLSGLALKCKWNESLHSKFDSFFFFISFDIKFLTKSIKNMIFNAVKKVTDIYILPFGLHLRYFLSLKTEFVCLIKSKEQEVFFNLSKHFLIAWLFFACPLCSPTMGVHLQLMAQSSSECIFSSSSSSSSLDGGCGLTAESSFTSNDFRNLVQNRFIGAMVWACSDVNWNNGMEKNGTIFIINTWVWELRESLCQSGKQEKKRESDGVGKRTKSWSVVDRSNGIIIAE